MNHTRSEGGSDYIYAGIHGVDWEYARKARWLGCDTTICAPTVHKMSLPTSQKETIRSHLLNDKRHNAAQVARKTVHASGGGGDHQTRRA